MDERAFTLGEKWTCAGLAAWAFIGGKGEEEKISKD
jgi:hypothetical protein